MKQFYFVRNGVEYPTGTILHMRGHDVCGKSTVIKMTFLSYNADKQAYYLMDEYEGKSYMYKEPMFSRDLIEITNIMSKSYKVPIIKYKSDSQIPELCIGWVWYIFIMGFLTIIQDRLISWAITSAIFFTWRNSVLEEKGWYYEW